MKRMVFLFIVVFLFVSHGDLAAQTADGYLMVGGGDAYHSLEKWSDMYVFRLDMAGQKVWRKQFGRSDRDWGAWGVQTTDGGYIVIGTITVDAGNTRNFFVNKLDTGGNVQWSKEYGASGGFEYGRCIEQTADGGYIIAGESDVINQTWPLNETDLLVYKVEADGKKEWRKNFGGTKSEYRPTVFQTADGGYLLAGSTSSYTHGTNDSDFVIYKINSAGLKEWRRNYGGIYGEGPGACISPTSDGGFVLIGGTSSYVHGVPGSDSDFLVYKFAANGGKQWRKNFGGSASDSGKSIQQTADGGYIIAGYTQSYVHGTGSDYDFLVYKLDASGNKLWRKNFGGINEDKATSIRQTADGGYIVAGSTQSYIHSYEDMLVYKLDAAGQKVWRKNFGGDDGGCEAYCIRQTVH